METHPEDATSSDDPWHMVSDEFGHLGRRLREAYFSVAGDDGPTEDQVKDAFATLGAAWSQVAGTVGAALQDAEIRERVRSAAGALAAALGATISSLGAELAEDGEEE